MKTCKTCGEEKPREAFSKNRRMGDGLQYRCKACDAEYRRKFRRDNPEWWRNYNRRYYERHRARRRDQARTRYQADEDSARKAFAAKIKRCYGITLSEYDAIVSQPCEICGGTERIVLDHCHTTGVIRGPLCSVCNTAIGKLGDDPTRLRAAAEYLERHKT